MSDPLPPYPRVSALKPSHQKPFQDWLTAQQRSTPVVAGYPPDQSDFFYPADYQAFLDVHRESPHLCPVCGVVMRINRKACSQTCNKILHAKAARVCKNDGCRVTVPCNAFYCSTLCQQRHKERQQATGQSRSESTRSKALSRNHGETYHASHCVQVDLYRHRFGRDLPSKTGWQITQETPDFLRVEIDVTRLANLKSVKPSKDFSND